MTEFREFQDGELIAGTRYRVLSLIGVGGMGSVYEVEHTELGKRFVLKALLRELSRRDDLVQRLRNEWRALARLEHANIVNVTDAGTSDGGVPFYVMERLDGDTLAGLLRRKRRLHVLTAVNIAESVLQALSAAHEIGIIHRDVKPANVFIMHDGKVKLLDFGIAKIANATGVVTARGLAVGTPRYMSPEQARGERVDGRSDIYATALILFEMIAGVGPFDDVRDANELLVAHMAREAPRLSSFLSGVSPELELILASMLAKDCRKRPAHARHAAEQLRDFALRQRSLPATDAPTEKAGYGAPTVQTARREPSPAHAIHEAITRPEGPLRKGVARDANPSADARTQRISLAPETTQVTLSASTGESFSISSVPSTTFVSPPSRDGSTTVRMSTAPTRTQSSVPLSSQPAVERSEPTEMLGEFPQVEPSDTRTQVPLPERTRPLSITPPPVVDTGRVEGSAARRMQPMRWWLGGVALALSLAIVTGVALQRATLSRTKTSEPVPVARPVLAKTASRAAPAAPQNVESAAPLVAPPVSAQAASAGPSPAPAFSSARVAPPAASGSARNSRMIFDAKHLTSRSLAGRSLAPRSAPPVPRSSIAARPSGPELPGSGL